MTDPWTREDQPFNYSATGYLGRKRPDMLCNHLLQRCRLGRGKGAGLGYTQSVPFGNSYRNPFTVADALTGWAGGALIPPQEKLIHPRKKMPNDFLQSNMAATSMGLTTAEEVKVYRQTRKLIPMVCYGPPDKMIVRPPPVKIKPGAVLGMKTVRHKESMTDLIAHVYHKQWYLEARRGTLQEIEKPNFKIKPTLATKLRHIEISTRTTKIPSPSRRIPPVLARVKPHLSTFRSENARQQAWDAHEKEIAESTCKPFSQVDQTEKLPHYHRVPPIQQHYHLCPPR